MVEAALNLGVVLTLLMGIIYFGLAAWTYNLMAHAAREGTRYAIVRGRSNKPPATAQDVSKIVRAQAVGMDLSKLTVNVSWIPNNIPGGRVKVVVSYGFSFLLPFVPQNVLTLKSTSEMMVIH